VRPEGGNFILEAPPGRRQSPGLNHGRSARRALALPASVSLGHGILQQAEPYATSGTGWEFLPWALAMPAGPGRRSGAPRGSRFSPARCRSWYGASVPPGPRGGGHYPFGFGVASRERAGSRLRPVDSIAVALHNGWPAVPTFC